MTDPMKFLRHACTLLMGGLASLIAGAADAPAPDRTEVLAVVQRFLDALAARDPAACRATIAPEGQLQALNDLPAGPRVSYRSLGEFADRLPTWKERPLERIWNPTVLIDGRVATIWAPYDFHRDGKFSHSGIDVFTLMRTANEWKIVNLAFTMRPDVPSAHPDGPPRASPP